MNEFGTYKGVEYEVSDSRAALKKIYFNNTNTNETFTRSIKDVTEERIKKYINDRILFTHMEKLLLKHFDNKSTCVFRTSNIFSGGEAITYSREIGSRITKSKISCCMIGGYKISVYSTNISRRKKYKAEKVRC